DGVPPGARSPSGQVAAYDGLRRLPASLLSEAGRTAVVLGVGLGALEESRFELYFGAAPFPGELDPEKDWDLSRPYEEGVAASSIRPEGAAGAEHVPPFLGSVSLRLEVQPLAELPYIL